jgi:hypothetical protein
LAFDGSVEKQWHKQLHSRKAIAGAGDIVKSLVSTSVAAMVARYDVDCTVAHRAPHPSDGGAVSERRGYRPETAQSFTMVEQEVVRAGFGEDGTARRSGLTGDLYSCGARDVSNIDS